MGSPISTRANSVQVKSQGIVVTGQISTKIYAEIIGKEGMRTHNLTYNNTRRNMLTCILGFQEASNFKLPPYWIKALQGRLVYENSWSDNLLLFIYTIPNNYQLEPLFDSPGSN